MIMPKTDDYIKLEHLNPENHNWFVVNWCLGSTCNFACSYCPTNLHDGKHKWHNTQNVKDFVQKIKTYHPDKNIYFEFTGGEVTLNKDFIDICKFCTSEGVKVGFISNGSRTIRWWEENKQFFDTVLLSFHSEFADPEHFCKVVELLHNDVRVHVNVMMKPENWTMCLDLAQKIKNIGNCSMALQPLAHELSGELFDYTEGQHYIFSRQYKLYTGQIKHTKSFDVYRGAMKTISQDGQSEPRTPHSFISRDTNNWEGWDCYAGVEQCIIDMDGGVWRGWCRVGGKIGFIGDPNLILPTDLVICNKNRCHCNYDIMSTKIKRNK
jgi:MoaA/NifB/PqqE/SkfB family radical SAM enzyme